MTQPDEVVSKAAQDDGNARWGAVLGYTIDDDGVWITLGKHSRNLGFDATLREAYKAARELEEKLV